MKQILAWLAVLALVGAALSVQGGLYKKGAFGAGVNKGGDLKTASSFIGPFGYGWGWGYPYWGYGWGGWGGGGFGYPYWG